MKTKIKTVIAGVVLGGMCAVVLAAGTEAAEVVTENENAISETLTAIVNFLPFPWNVIGGAALTAGGALWAWRKTKKKTD